jgi:hypothetical protein
MRKRQEAGQLVGEKVIVVGCGNTVMSGFAKPEPEQSKHKKKHQAE